MADYSISAEISLDDSKFSSGVKKAQNSSKKLSSSISKVVQGFGKGGLAGSVASAGLALGGIGLAVGTAIKAFQKISKAIGECSEAFKKQEKAEIALETAIKNSSSVTDTAVKTLKEYASELQKTTNLADEDVLPMMTQLIATGRTEAEVMQIIATASDMSATGTISFDTAVTQLNATLNGNIGRLGQQNAELKALTEEELKSGKAVEILAGKYKGLATATVDTKKQLQNAVGDLKESFGAVFEKALSPMRKFFAEIIQGWADARKAKQQYEESEKAVEAGKGTIEQLQIVIEERQKGFEQLKLDLEALQDGTEEWDWLTKEAIDLKKEEIKQAERELGILNAQLSNKQRQQELEKRQAEADAKTAENEKTISELKAKYLEKIAQQEAKWRNIKTVTGEVVSTEEKIKFYEDSLVDIMTEAGGQISTNNQYYKDQLAIIQKLQAELKPEEKETSDTWAKKIREQAIERLEAEKESTLALLEEQGRSADERIRIESEYNYKLMHLNLERIQEEREEALKSVEGFANAEEEKARIYEYYQNLIVENAGKYSQQIQKEMETSAISWGKKIADGINGAMPKIKTAFEKISKIAKSVGDKVGKAFKGLFTGGKSLLSKVFNFDPNEALDGLLAFEDKVLTFFQITLPKLPAFISSALQSISVMLKTIKLNIDKNKVRALMRNITDTMKQYLPDIVKVGLSIASEILEGFATGIKDNAETIGEIIKTLSSTVIEYLPTIVMSIISAVGSLISAIPESAIVEIIDGVIDLVVKVANALINNAVTIAQKLVPALFEIILQLFKKLPEILKTVLWEVVKGLGKVASFIWDGIKKLFGFANGTNNAPRGLAIVGEQGPELIDFRGGEKVYNNTDTNRMLQGTKSGSVFNVTFNNTQDTTAFAMMKQLKQYQRNLAFNGVL